MGPIGENMVVVTYVPTKRNIADTFTKGLPLDVLKSLIGYLIGSMSLNELLKIIKDEGGHSQRAKGQTPNAEGPDGSGYPDPEGDMEGN